MPAPMMTTSTSVASDGVTVIDAPHFRAARYLRHQIRHRPVDWARAYRLCGLKEDIDMQWCAKVDEPRLIGGAGEDTRVRCVLSERAGAPVAEEHICLGVIAQARRPHHAVHTAPVRGFGPFDRLRIAGSGARRHIPGTDAELS